jgi:hypothetical protein
MYAPYSDGPRCYTNHALDQFLEHILASKATQRIVRIGSRSKSTLLENFNLHAVANAQKKFVRTRQEVFEETKLYKTMEGIEVDGTALCETLTHGVSRIRFGQIASLVKQEFPDHYNQLLCEPDEDGFIVVGVKDKSYFDYWLSGKDLLNRDKSTLGVGQPRSLRSILRIPDIWALTQRERRILVQHWEERLREEWIDGMSVHGESADEVQLKLNTLQSEFNARVIEKVDVVGITTTGLARYGSLLKRVQSKTLICEEAGEVLEVSGNKAPDTDSSHIC